jgi:hypothetical protein
MLGLRKICEDENYKIGDYCRHSYDWDFEYDCSKYYTDKENGDIGGTCTIYAEDLEDAHDEIEKLSVYLGDTIIIVDGDFVDWGDDDGEVILANAKVIKILHYAELENDRECKCVKIVL